MQSQYDPTQTEDVLTEADEFDSSVATMEADQPAAPSAGEWTGPRCEK